MIGIWLPAESLETFYANNPNAFSPPMSFLTQNLKWISFIILIIQASTHTIVTRYSRLQPGPPYIPSTAVIMSEINKFFISLVIHVWGMVNPTESYGPDFEEHGSLLPASKPHKLSSMRYKSLTARLFYDVFGPESDWLAMFVPAALYFIQNVLNYWAATYLDPATFQITAQLKILTTAIFSVLMLGTKLPLSKWILLTMVAFGVIVIQLQDYSDETAGEAKTRLAGIFCVILSSTTSGFAGIWFEKALKGKQKVSLFLRNLQLSLFTIAPGFLFGGLFYSFLNRI
jgi:UDP-sugar transporter A1/2/3